MLVGVQKGGWREAIQHDGFFVVRLRVFRADEGGQNRHVQSGMKAHWMVQGDDRVLPGLLDLPDQAVRSVAPGGITIVQVRPLEPFCWAHVEPGMRLAFCKNPPRELGEGHVVERVDVPYEHIPPRFRSSPTGTPAIAALRRKPTLGERTRSAFAWFGHRRGR